jgi:Flp pilus assembly protein TadD
MPLPVTSQYAPPQSWEEFESLCCDLYTRIWNDPGTQKHGRQGQPQGGVDVYGRPDGENYSGVQCKKKDIWPPTQLTTSEIDEEVAKAKTWAPGLKHYIIATTAPNDEKVQTYVRAITKAHSRKKLLSVEVASWDEITRRLAGHPDLLRTYGYRPEINIAETARLVSEHLRQKPQIPGERPTNRALAQSVKQDPAVVEALERDLVSRFSRAMRRSFFPETIQVDDYVSVAEIACEPEYAYVSPELRRRILLRAARSAAVRGTIEKAEELLRQAQSLTGSDSDVLARARILESRFDIDGALALIRDETDADSRSTVFNMLVRHRGTDVGLKWFEDEKLTVSDLTINGLQTMAAAHLQTADFDGLRARLDNITPQQLSDGPYFRFLRAMVNVASILPLPDRGLAVRAFQMDVRRGTRSILDAATTAARLDRAIDDLTALLPVAAELGLNEAKRLAEAYIRWCELLHPYRKDSGLATLRHELKDPKTARERLSLAFAFDPNFQPGPLQEYLKRREQFGGLDDDDLRAALIIQIHSDDPASVAALIARHRARFESQYKDPPIFTIELQALALAGDTSSARVLLDKHRNDLTPDDVAGFEGLIAKGEGKDPVAEDLKLYESTKTLESLRALVMSLAARKDHRATAKYSEELFALTSDPHDIARAAHALALLGDGAEFIRVVDTYPFVQGQAPGLLRHYAWELFSQGRLREAKDCADRLARDFAPDRDLQLEIAIAIEAGEWESLAKPLSAYLDDVPKHSGLDLIRAAHIAQQSGQGPMMDLVRAAVAKGEDNPHVWLGAYTIIVEEGLEEHLPEYHDWFHRALALSDKKGPVQHFDLKELVPQQLEWNKRTRDISDRVTKAEVPLVIAAPGLRTTVVDILLRNLVRNSQLDEARRKYVIPLFSGHRSPWQGGLTFDNLGLDVSALLVLGWLGLLQKVFQAYKVVTLPATVLTELFDGRRRVQQVQKSRIKRARELEQALRRITVARPTEKDSDPLSAEVGASLAALIRAAAETDGTVLRPAPVHRPGLEQIPADVTGELPYLCDMHTLLTVLTDRGVVSQPDEETAKKYFELQDKGLVGCAVPDTAKPLFIDGLALIYLQYTNLLGPVLSVFKDVRVEGSSADEALAIIEHDQHVAEVLNVIDDIRNTIRAANASGKISFGPRRAEGSKLRGDDTPSTLHLLSDLAAVDAVVCDDRALNKQNFADDGKGKRIPLFSTLDVLEELRTRRALSEAEWMAARHRLRNSGAALLPVQTSEVVHAARRSRSAMSPEMRAIRQSIDLARVAEIPTFPREVQWFAAVSMAIKAAVVEMWKTEGDPVVAGRLSNLIMSLVPKPNDWASRWEAGPPPQWADAVDRIILASLAMPVELTDGKVVDAYNVWYEQNHLESLRSVWPERYRAVVEQVRSFILNAEDDNDEKEEKQTK